MIGSAPLLVDRAATRPTVADSFAALFSYPGARQKPGASRI
jgi:hypothetical protein